MQMISWRIIFLYKICGIWTIHVIRVLLYIARHPNFTTCINLCTFSIITTRNEMDTRRFLISLFLGVTIFLSAVLGFPHAKDSRFRRSPRKVNPWCQSAFLNFATFSPRMCPKPPLCKLSRPLNRRKCT
jgi:hypothetical protein